MRSFSLFFLILLGLFMGSFRAQAQHTLLIQKDFSSPEVDFSISLKGAKNLRVGSTFTVCFKGTIQDAKWHLYSSNTEGDLAYRPTALILDAEKAVGVELKGAMREDKVPTEQVDEIMQALLRQFDDHEVTFCQDIRITAADARLEANLEVQICCDGMCKFYSIPWSWDMSN